LGYTSDATGAGSYRKIHLVTKQKNLLVRTRDGYYAERDELLSGAEAG